MKHIGIAAITAEGAALTYRALCREAERRFGRGRHPEITLHTFPFAEFLGEGTGRRERWAGLMRASMEKLVRAGAELVICPANTNHEVYDAVVSQLPVPWLHIADAVLEEAKARSLRRLGLLGTAATMSGEIYQSRARNHGITIVVPSEKTQERVNRTIYDELVPGTVSDGARGVIEGAVRELEREGSDAVILGCTELPLAIDAERTQLPLLDSTELLAIAALVEATR